MSILSFKYQKETQAPMTYFYHSSSTMSNVLFIQLSPQLSRERRSIVSFN